MSDDFDPNEIEAAKKDYLKRLSNPMKALAAQQTSPNSEVSTPSNANDIEGIKAKIQENESQPIAHIAHALQRFAPIAHLLGINAQNDYGVPANSKDIAGDAVAPLQDFEAKRDAIRNILKQREADNVMKHAQELREQKETSLGNPSDAPAPAPVNQDLEDAKKLRTFAANLKGPQS